MSAQDSQGLFGKRISKHFGFEQSSTLTVATADGVSVALTHLSSDVLGQEPAPIPVPEPAFSIMVQLAPLDWHELQLGSSLSFAGAVPEGAVSVVDLEDGPRTRMSGRFEGLQVYVPRRALDALCREHRGSLIGSLSRPRAEPDPIALTMSSLLIPHLQATSRPDTLFVEHVTLAFLAHAAQSYGHVVFGARQIRGGLSPWQERRAMELLRSSLDGSISLKDLARECGVSSKHFAAAFKITTGHPPYRYLMRLRLEHAKHLLLMSDLPLVDVALRCGFASQSHFTRMFTRAVGCGPGVWRRRMKF